MTVDPLSENTEIEQTGASELAEAVDQVEAAVVVAAVAGVSEANRGAERLELAADLAAAGAEMLAQGASDLTRAVDEKVASQRMAVLSDAVAVAGVADIAEGAEILAASHDVGVMSALVGMMSEESIQHGLELARISGELETTAELVAELQMPVLASFLSNRSDRLHEMSVEQIHKAISAEGVSQLIAESGSKVKALGENEVDEGVARLAVAAAASRASAEMSDASDALAEQGLTEMALGGMAGKTAREEAMEGAAEISAGSAVLGAALAIEDVAAKLQPDSE